MLIKNNVQFSPDANGDMRASIGYYESIAQKYRAISLIVGAITCILVLLMLLFGYKEFTYENVFYFIKDFDTVISSGSYSTDYVEYGTGENRSYHSYRGGIVAASKYTVSVYSSTGRETATFIDEYVSPNVCTSSKYILVFDSNGNSFSVYNSFLRIYSETLDYTVYAAYINDRGEFLIHTSSEEYSSVIYHYDNNFERVAAYYFVDHVVDSVISDDGRYIYITTVGIDGGEYISTLNIYRSGADQAAKQYCIEDVWPLKCIGYNKGCCLLADNMVVVLDSNGTVLYEYKFENDHIPDLYASDKNGLAVVIGNDTEWNLIYVPFGGDPSFIQLDGRPVAIDIFNSSAYILYNGTVLRYDFLKDETVVKECPPNAGEILITSEGVVYLCYPSRAICCKF